MFFPNGLTVGTQYWSSVINCANKVSLQYNYEVIYQNLKYKMEIKLFMSQAQFYVSLVVMQC